MLKSPHATIDVEEARHIAGNPDGCDKQDLMAFWNWAGCSQVRPLRQSRELWPDELMADVKGFERIGPNGRLEALSGIKGYVTNPLQWHVANGEISIPH